MEGPHHHCRRTLTNHRDSYHRYGEDIAILAGLGLSSYRFSLEWSRIEPEDGELSAASRDHYRRMIEPARQLRVDVGYRPTFGIVAVNRTTFERTVKPSARILGEIARTNELDPA